MAYGDKYYLRAAWALLCNIRAYYPDTLVHLEYDRSWDFVSLSEDELQIIYSFDSQSNVIDFDVNNIYEPKLHLHEYSPFKETLYIDADALIFKNNSILPYSDLVLYYKSLIPAFINDWVLIPAINGVMYRDGTLSGGPVYTYHGEPEVLMNNYNLDVLPNVSTGIVYFKKGKALELLMKDINTYFNDVNAPAFRLPSGTGRADEFPYNIVIGKYCSGPFSMPIPHKFQPMHFHRIGQIKSYVSLNKEYIGIQLGTHKLPEYVNDIAKHILNDVYSLRNIELEMRYRYSNKADSIPWRKSF